MNGFLISRLLKNLANRPESSVIVSRFAVNIKPETTLW